MRQEYNKVLETLRDALGEEALAKLMDEGRTWSEDQAIEEAQRT